MDLILGTRNRKKGEELLELLAPWGFRLITLADVPDSIEVEETGETFAANAALKACEQARHLKRWVLGEDSGLAVDVLKGAPGVYSARFSGPNATDERNNQLLLEKLRGIENRAARFVCSIALVESGHVRGVFRGAVEGRILDAPRGGAGFGYDPLFYYEP